MSKSSIFRRVAFATLILSSGVFSLSFVAADQPKEKDAATRIDTLVLEGLKKENLKPNADTDDSTFVRRVYLDLIGRIPTRAETAAFLDSKSPNKRTELVDALVGSDGYNSSMYNWFADLLRLRTSISGNGQSSTSGLAYEYWIKDAIRENRPYDKMVYDLITASGSSWQNPAVGYYLRDYGMPLDNLAMTIQVFLGTQIVCAQCHNHPFEEVTQMDYYHMAAFTYGMVGSNARPTEQQALNLAKKGVGGEFAKPGVRKGKQQKGQKGSMSEADFAGLRKAASEILTPLRFSNIIETQRQLRLPKDYKYDDANPLAVVTPTTYFGEVAKVDGSEPPIQVFGKWLTSSDNKLFAKVIANRLWKRAFGLGLVEPVDDFKDNVAAANPDLLDYLAELMVSYNYDLQKFERVLYRTQAYQREVSREEPAMGAHYYFQGPILRRMSAEQIWDSLVAMTTENSDAPDAARRLYAERQVAKVHLIAESVYDQNPKEFLSSMRQVVEAKRGLNSRIKEAEAKIETARQSGDEEAIRRAVRDARDIKKEIDTDIEELVYRKGLERKLAALRKEAPAEQTALIKSESRDKEEPSLMSALAAQIFTGNRTMDEGMSEIVGSDKDGIINDLIDAMFAQRQADLDAKRKERIRQERAAWHVGRKAGNAVPYRMFDKVIRDRMKRASEVSQPAPAGHFLREFGQSDRELVENSNHEASITQALALLNGPVLSAIVNPYSVLMRDMKGENFSERINTVYLTMLSRLPTDQEKAIFVEAGKTNPELQTISGIVWTLLNTRQFLFVQ